MVPSGRLLRSSPWRDYPSESHVAWPATTLIAPPGPCTEDAELVRGGSDEEQCREEAWRGHHGTRVPVGLCSVAWRGIRGKKMGLDRFSAEALCLGAPAGHCLRTGPSLAELCW